MTDPPSWPVTAVALSGRPDLRGAADALPGERMLQSAAQVSTRLSGDQTLHVFGIGAIVVEGAKELDDALIESITKTLGHQVLRDTMETYTLEVDPSGPARNPRVGWDHVVLPSDATEVRLPVLRLLAQSAALERYELGAAEMVDETLSLARRFAAAGRPPWRRGLPVRRAANVAVHRLELARWFFPLDRPESTWEDPTIARLHDAFADNLELRDRHAALLHKLASVEGTLRIVIDLWEGRRSRFLEWAIVILIVVEIVLALVEGAW